MDIVLKNIEKKDYKKAMHFAIEGMHFNWYLNNKLLLNLYGRYFWYLELTRATQVIAAYEGNELTGVLLADMKGERNKYKSLWKSLYIKIFAFLQRMLYRGADVYDVANSQMFEEYLKDTVPEGEIIFLAVDPKIKTKGVGSKLFLELERRECGKTVYLYTDNACTYQFYEHRGFSRIAERDIELNLGNKTVPLKCLLYSKVL